MGPRQYRNSTCSAFEGWDSVSLEYSIASFSLFVKLKGGAQTLALHTVTWVPANHNFLLLCVFTIVRLVQFSHFLIGM